MKTKLSILLLICSLLASATVKAQFWGTQGNPGTIPGTHYIGTTDLKDVVFKTNGNEVMRLFANPNAPFWSRLKVDGTLGLTGSQAGLLLFDRATSQTSSMWFSPVRGETRLYDYATGANRFVVKPNGFIGVGTDTPDGKLHIHDGLIRLTGHVPQYGGPMIVFGGVPITGPAQGGEFGIECQQEPGLRPGLNFWRPSGATNSTGGFAPYMNYVLFLSNDNRVGINTDNPTADLTVNGRVLIGSPTTPMPGNYKLYVPGGGILTDKVKVALASSANWGDYVFSPNYQLRSLAEVEAYIQSNGHLPEVASANDLVKEGLDLGEMQATQIRKIEELTLYVIDLKKEVELLKTENVAFKSAMQAIKK